MKGLITIALLLSCALYGAPQNFDETTHESSTSSPLKDFIVGLFQTIIQFFQLLLGYIDPQSTTATTETTTVYTTPIYEPYCYYYYIQQDYYDDNIYYECVNYTLKTRYCPDGEAFNINTLSCGGTCIAGLTKEMPDPKPYDYNKYLECVDGTWVEETCPYGKYYYLWQKPHCISLYCWNGSKQADPLDNNKYLECEAQSNGSYIWAEKSCQSGERFDRNYQVCVNATCSSGEKTYSYTFYDTLYYDCGELKSCPNLDRFWTSLKQCIGSGTAINITTSLPSSTGSPSTTTEISTTSIENFTVITDYPSTTEWYTTSFICDILPPYYYNYYTTPYFECDSGVWVLKSCPAGTSFYLSPVGGYCMQYESCPYYANKDFINPPSDLPNLVNNGSLYYTCWGAWYLQSCPPGQLFDKNALACAENATHYENGSEICTIGERKPIQYNDRAYYECQGSEWVAFDCPPGNVYFKDTQQCNSTCVYGESKLFEQDNIYNDGSFYLYCTGYYWVLSKCDYGIYNSYYHGCYYYYETAPITSTQLTS